MKNTFATLLLSWAVCCAPLGLKAQTTTTAPRHHNFVQVMTAKLGLTPEQQSQATTIFQNAYATEATIHTSLKTAHQGLSDAIKSNNTVSIEQLSNTIGTLTAQMTVAQAKAHAAFYQILTPQQKSTFDQMQLPHGPRFRSAGHSGMPMNGQ